MTDKPASRDKIYHLVTETDFRSLTKDNTYLPALFEQGGFIHCTGEPATLLLNARDYDGGGKCWVRFEAADMLDIVPGSRVEILDG